MNVCIFIEGGVCMFYISVCVYVLSKWGCMFYLSVCVYVLSVCMCVCFI